MGNVRVVMNSAGARSLLNSGEIQEACLVEAQKIRSTAMSMSGCDYDADVQPGKNRAHAMAKTSDFNSRRDNAKNNTLLKAMGR